MKVLGIVCSSRKGGNTEILVKEALSGAQESGAEIELFTTRGKNIKPCDGCYACEKTGACHIKDDMQVVYEKMLAADGIILGTPVYFWTVAGQAKILIDRTIALTQPRLMLADKVAGAVAVASRQGTVSALNVFQRYFAHNHMFAADLVEGLANEKGAIVRDKRAMAFLLEKKLKFPDEFDVPLHEYVKKKYRVPRYPTA